MHPKRRRHSSSLELEASAARRALEIAGLHCSDLDLLICTSLLADHQGVGGATYLARELGFRGAAWNVESGSSSTLTAMQTAHSLIASSQYRRALIVTSCVHSRAAQALEDSIEQTGDAAFAMILGPTSGGAHYLASHSLQAEAVEPVGPYRLAVDSEGHPMVAFRSEDRAGAAIRRTAEQTLASCVHGALEKAGAQLSDIDHLVIDRIYPWLPALCSQSLGLDPQQMLSLYPLCGDVGPALLGLNLLHAAHWNRFAPGDLVVLCTADSSATSHAAVLRWGDVALDKISDGIVHERLRLDNIANTGQHHVQRLDAEVLGPASRAAGLEDRLERMISSYVALAVDEPAVMKLFSGTESSQPSILRECITRFTDSLEALLSECLAGQRSKVEPKIAALSLFGIIHWGVCCHLAEQRLQRDEAVAQITFLALHGLASEPSPRYGRRAFSAA